MIPVTILGGGPAGASAALAALAEGAPATVIEKSAFPRHKVCGEFFSPETAGELERLGVWDAFLAAGPAPVRRVALHFGSRSRVSALPGRAWGLSRLVFDDLLLRRASSLGATVVRHAAGADPAVIAAGRRPSPEPRGARVFGFKAHFDGPACDAVELFFFPGGYVGLSPVESGRTNICGLALESFLARTRFEYDAVLEHSEPLRERVAPLLRATPWLSTGPLQYAQHFRNPVGKYVAGDWLSFVDPFTGSGLLAAVKTGALAGRAAARARPVEDYLADCRASLARPFSAAAILRKIVESGWAELLVRLAPSRLLFSITRPR
jgi:flavin-dependent dehydrogenase